MLIAFIVFLLESLMVVMMKFYCVFCVTRHMQNVLFTL